MTEEVVPGGRRRIDRVMAPQFLENLDELSDEEFQQRQAEASQEEADLSFVRRLVQGRLDQLRAEVRERGQDAAPRVAGTRSDEELVAMLASALAEPRPPATRSGRYIDVEPTQPAGRRREIEKVANDIELSDPGSLSDESLTAAVEKLTELEDRASTMRRRVQSICDALEEADERRRLYN